MLIGMMTVTAELSGGAKRVLGSVHNDAGGYVAWDPDHRWMGATTKARFKTERDAIEALIAAQADRRTLRKQIVSYRVSGARL